MEAGINVAAAGTAANPQNRLEGEVEALTGQFTVGSALFSARAGRQAARSALQRKEGMGI